ncbi:MAG TPA: hypothetical protein VM536_22440, partial [Chloroflexia bacterium]|nr:hypothetical protein [Chloroflexia bacterium]
EAGDNPYNFYDGVLAHEFQHMVHWNVQREHDIWINEGCSEIAMALSGYDVGGSDQAFRQTPDVQLTGWSELPEKNHYGASYLFVRYLMEHYGGSGFLKALMASPGTGVEAVTDALKRQRSSLTFEDVFKDWTVANAIADPEVGDGRYGYEAVSAPADIDKRIIRYPATLTGDVHQYGTDYISLERGGGDTVVEFQGAATAALVPTQPHSGRRFWYSNRRDAGNMTLTHPFDLSRVSRVTLDFWTWYQIEGDFDYGYVEVSTDGGQTWATQKTAHTTDTDPNGANFGHGYTGPSGRSPQSKATPLWIHEQVDLSAYAGKAVLVRFQYLTDTGFNLPSWAVDDIRIAELNYYSDAETDDGGWEATGWVRVANAVPQGWFVAALQYGGGEHAVTVQTVALDAAGHGRIVIPALGSTVRRVTLVVAALAPTTTEIAHYRVTARRAP